MNALDPHDWLAATDFPLAFVALYPAVCPIPSRREPAWMPAAPWVENAVARFGDGHFRITDEHRSGGVWFVSVAFRATGSDADAGESAFSVAAQRLAMAPVVSGGMPAKPTLWARLLNRG